MLPFIHQQNYTYKVKIVGRKLERKKLKYHSFIRTEGCKEGKMERWNNEMTERRNNVKTGFWHVETYVL